MTKQQIRQVMMKYLDYGTYDFRTREAFEECVADLEMKFTMITAGIEAQKEQNKTIQELVEKAWEEYRKKGVCPACGFKNGGILQLHNMSGECWLMENTRIKPLLDKIKPSDVFD